MNNQQITDTEDPETLFEHFAFTVDPGQEPMRIDRWLMHRIAHASRTKIQAAIDAGSVLVNEKSTKSNYKVNPKIIFEFYFPKNQETPKFTPRTYLLMWFTKMTILPSSTNLPEWWFIPVREIPQALWSMLWFITLDNYP